ncbi:MAG: PAS domain S-box protein [Candidatus Thorarchaeota archaeon]
MSDYPTTRPDTNDTLELRDQIMHLRALSDTMNSGFGVIDKNNDLVYVNKAFADMLGYSCTELEGIALLRFVVKHNFTILEENIEKWTSGKPSQYELEWISESGVISSSIVSGTPLKNKDGYYIGSILIIFDISEEKKVDRTLREQGKRAQEYLDVAGVMIVALDVNGSVSLINQKGCEILGYSSEDIIDKDWIDTFIPERDKHAVRNNFKGLMNGSIQNIPYRERCVVTRRGEQRTIAWHTNVLTDKSGTIAGVLSSGEDITELKQIEMKLRESEELYRTLVETSPDAIVVTSLEAKIVMVNKSLLTLTGAESEEELIGMNVLELVIPEERQEAMKMILSAPFTPQLGPIELTHLRLDGSTCPVELSCSIIKTLDGSPRAFLAIIRDISGRRRALESLQTSNQMSRLYLDLMSHDITNQLQVILFGTEILGFDTQEPTVTKKLDHISRAATNCVNIIAKIRTTEGLLDAPLKPISLESVLRDCVEQASVKYRDVGIECDLLLSSTLVLADDFLEFLFDSFIENAIEHNPFNEKCVWISLSKREDGYEVRIADNGEGLPDEKKKWLFDSQRRHGGISLHQSEQIAKKYGGRIEVFDRIPMDYHSGTEFRIWFPKFV